MDDWPIFVRWCERTSIDCLGLVRWFNKYRVNAVDGWTSCCAQSLSQACINPRDREARRIGLQPRRLHGSILTLAIAQL